MTMKQNVKNKFNFCSTIHSNGYNRRSNLVRSTTTAVNFEVMVMTFDCVRVARPPDFFKGDQVTCKQENVINRISEPFFRVNELFTKELVFMNKKKIHGNQENENLRKAFLSGDLFYLGLKCSCL